MMEQIAVIPELIIGGYLDIFFNYGHIFIVHFIIGGLIVAGLVILWQEFISKKKDIHHLKIIAYSILYCFLGVGSIGVSLILCLIPIVISYKKDTGISKYFFIYIPIIALVLNILIYYNEKKELEYKRTYGYQMFNKQNLNLNKSIVS